MKKIPKIIISFFILALFTACSEEGTEPSFINAKINGKVTDTNGNLLNDVDIFLIYNLTDIPSYGMGKVTGIDTVVFDYFEVSFTYESVKFNWGTASEINNQGFEIQRKTVGDFEVIGFVAGNGTTTEPKSDPSLTLML